MLRGLRPLLTRASSGTWMSLSTVYSLRVPIGRMLLLLATSWNELVAEESGSSCSQQVEV